MKVADKHSKVKKCFNLYGGGGGRFTRPIPKVGARINSAESQF